MSAKRKLFNSVKTAIETVSAIKTVRRWNGQTDNEPLERGYKTPAVFIEIVVGEWRTMLRGEGSGASNQQQGDAIVTLHVQHINYEDETTADEVVEVNEQAIYHAVNMLEKNNTTDGFFTPLQRIFDLPDFSHNQSIVNIIGFKTLLFEQGIQELLTTIPGDTITPVNDPEIELDIDNETIRTGDGIFD